MISKLKGLSGILTPEERRSAVWVFLLMLLVAVFEAAGVASILPFISVLTDPDGIENSRWLSSVYEWSGVSSEEGFTVLLGALFIGVFISSIALKSISQWQQVKYTKMRVHSIGCRLLEGYLRQPYEWFLSKHTSKMTTTILSEINQVISGSLFPIMQMMAHGVVAFALLALLFAVDFILATSLLVFLGLSYGLLYLAVRKPLLRFGRRRYEANSERFRVTQETFGGVKDLKIRCLEPAMVERFRSPSFRTANEEVKATIVQQIPGQLMQALIVVGVIMVLLYLNQRHSSFAAALPTFSAFAFAGYRLMPALQQIYRQLTKLRSNTAALEGLIGQVRSVSSSYGGVHVDSSFAPMGVKQGVKLVNLRYRYPASDRDALNGITLSIPANSRVGLVGVSGSGKTTTVDVILGLLRPTEGRMLVDGLPISDRNVRNWQQSVGYVPQHIFLGDDTVAANIAFGLQQHKIDSAAVEKAARIANLHNFIINELPNGYETKVGERGVRLSGGQRQRIGIARALYHDPDVLLLDEATSALDNVTERAVMEAIDRLSGQKTIILIAHRLSTVEKCDSIIVLENGSIVGHGSYQELVDNNDEFRAMAGAGSQVQT